MPGGRLSGGPNWLRQLHVAPDDGGYNLKWDLNNDGTLSDGSDTATPDADMDWQEAFNFLGPSFSGSAVVAIIDTGIDFQHPDLEAKINTDGYDYLDGDFDPTDTYGHGTHVAGIVLAETGNGNDSSDPDTAGVGLSPNIRVMPMRVGDSGGCPTSAIVDAIYDAADNGADVINLSLGGRFGSAAEEQAIDYAWGRGLVVVASSGNDGSGKVSYPAAFARAIAVGATDWHDAPAPYSNKGSDLDVTAPGGAMDRYDDPGGIYSTMPTGDVYLTTTYSYDNNYDQLQGTSMAAPQVSGLAALLFSLDPGLSNAEIRSIIESTADDDGVTQVEFFVDGGSIGVDSNGDDGWSITWQTASVADGTRTVTATATATATDTASRTTTSDGVTVTVDNVADTAVAVSGVVPNRIQAGTSTDVTISGSGFAAGADVGFENGSGPAPAVSNVIFDEITSTIGATITVKSGGPPRERAWDVRVTNPDGSTGVLSGGLTVTP